MGSGVSVEKQPQNVTVPHNSAPVGAAADVLITPDVVEVDIEATDPEKKLKKSVSFSDLKADSSSHKKMPPKKPLQKTVSELDKSGKIELEKNHPELRQTLRNFQPCIDFLKDNNNKRADNCEKSFHNLNELLQLNIVKAFSEYENEEQRKVMGNKLADLGFVPEAVIYYKFTKEELDIEAVTSPLVEEGKNTKEPGIQLIMTFREIFWNFSDENGSFAVELAKTELFSFLATDLEFILEDSLDDLDDTEDLFAFSSAVGILHNCAREPDVDKEAFRKVSAANKLQPFLNSKHVFVKMITLLALAHIIGETESDKLGTEDPEVFDFLFKEIGSAVGARDHRSNGFSVSELVDGLASLAKAETNREHIMEKDPLPMIRKLLKSSETVTKHAAVGLVWELCFSDKIRKHLSKDEEIKKQLESLQRGNDSLARDAQYALFCMRGNLSRRPSRVAVPAPEQPAVQKSLPKPDTEQHIMISYNWSDQKTIIKIRDGLENAGYRVWLDLNNMGNYLLQGMAEAVEGAFLVLICYSEKYKDSRNCRLEADYTFAKAKPFLPVKMQQGFTPDGWLGILIGARLFYEFSGKYPFDSKLAELLKAIEHIRRPASNTERPPPEPRPQSPPDSVKKWNQEKITQWLRANKLESGKLKQLKQLTGEHIVFLHSVHKNAADTFYRFLETKLELKTLEDIMRFTNAITELRII